MGARWRLGVAALLILATAVGVRAATDNAAARTRTASTVSCAATNTTSGTFVIQSTASAIQYATAQTGTCTYDVYLSLKRLS